MKDQDTKNRFIELRAKGLSFSRITQEVGVSKQTLINWSKDLQLEIDNLKRIELEALQEKYFLTAQKRLELFGEKLTAVKEELDKRELSDIPTEKLVDILLKLDKALIRERASVKFTLEDSLLTGIDTFTSSWEA